VLDSVLNRNVYLSSLVDAGTAQRRRIPDPNGTANRRTVIGEKGTVGVIGRAVRPRECEIKASSAEGAAEMGALLSRAIPAIDLTPELSSTLSLGL